MSEVKVLAETTAETGGINAVFAIAMYFVAVIGLVVGIYLILSFFLGEHGITRLYAAMFEFAASYIAVELAALFADGYDFFAFGSDTDNMYIIGLLLVLFKALSLFTLMVDKAHLVSHDNASDEEKEDER